MDEAANIEQTAAKVALAHWLSLVLAILVQQSPRNEILNDPLLGCWLGHCQALGIKVKQNTPA